jgi:hypothetical protein
MNWIFRFLRIGRDAKAVAKGKFPQRITRRRIVRAVNRRIRLPALPRSATGGASFFRRSYPVWTAAMRGFEFIAAC